VSIPTLHDLVSRWTAGDRALPAGAAIWYRQPFAGGYGQPILIPGVFDRYGAIRVRVVIRDATDREHRIYVNPDNVFVRFPGEAEGATDHDQSSNARP